MIIRLNSPALRRRYGGDTCDGDAIAPEKLAGYLRSGAVTEIKTKGRETTSSEKTGEKRDAPKSKSKKKRATKK